MSNQPLTLQQPSPCIYVDMVSTSEWGRNVIQVTECGMDVALTHAILSVSQIGDLFSNNPL